MAYDSNTIPGLSVTTPTENASYIPELNDAIREIKRALQYANAVVTITNTDSPYTPVVTTAVILADASTAAITVDLATATCVSGQKFIVKNIGDGSYDVTVSTEGAETIDGANTITLGKYGKVELISDGTNWHRISNDIESGTKALFKQAAAPLGWTEDDTIQDNSTIIYKRTGSYNGVDAGSDSAISWTSPVQYLANESSSAFVDPIANDVGIGTVAEHGEVLSCLISGSNTWYYKKDNVNAVTYTPLYTEVICATKD